MRDLTAYHYTKIYNLILRDGNNWHITSDKDNTLIIDKFANIMSLKESQPDGFPKLLFTSKNKKDDYTEYEDAKYKDTEWEYYDCGVVHIWCHRNDWNVICEVSDDLNDTDRYLAMWNSIQCIFRRSLQFGGIPFHTGLAEYKGQGVLFAATSGTGKSTCCRRLPSHWKVLCDDEALIVRDNKKTYSVHPFPTWSEYLSKRAENKWDVQYSVPVSAIFFLEQSEKDEVIPLSAEKASILISSSSVQALEKTWKRMIAEEKTVMIKAIFNNAFEMATVIPAYRLRVSLNGQFWEEVEKVMTF